jgi:hypothetical protein
MSGAELKWIKASASMATGACVEVAADRDEILVRNSRRPEHVIRYTRAEMTAFIEGVRRGEFDDLVAGTG